MPRKGITIYELLISCPGDVLDYFEVLKESVENFNRLFGILNNIEVVIKHWSTDSYPESGDKPQELLNKQFVRDCDAAVVIFSTRFGTPTDKYGSGTEEEIEEMMAANKQVFMYFLDAPISPSTVDIDQYQKVKAFQEKYKDRGLYGVVKDKNDFQRKFTNHLSLYFLRLISEESNEGRDILKPNLIIKDKNTLSNESYSPMRCNLLKSNFIYKKREKIIEAIKILKSNILPLNVTDLAGNDVNSDLNKDNNFSLTIQKAYCNSFNRIIDSVKIDEKWKNAINEFAEKNNIKIEKEFWNIGNLKRWKSQINFSIGNNAPVYEGSTEEKKRFSLLKKLYQEVTIYNQYYEYFKYIDSIDSVELMISNEGKTFDEDIDVKIILPKGHRLKKQDIPYPGIDIIDEVLDLEVVEKAFAIKESDTVSKYSFPAISKIDNRKINNFPLLQRNKSEEYEDNKDYYYSSLDSLFIYEEFENKEVDILKFSIRYLKHNTSMSFPSVLIFETLPQTIEYEISSKHMADVIHGKIVLNKEMN